MKQNVLLEIKLSICGNIHCISWQMHCIQIALAAAKGFQPPINQLSEYRKTGTFKLLACTVPTSLPKRTVLYFCSKTSTIYDVNILWRTQRRLKFESGSKRVKSKFYHFLQMSAFVLFMFHKQKPEDTSKIMRALWKSK